MWRLTHLAELACRFAVLAAAHMGVQVVRVLAVPPARVTGRAVEHPRHISAGAHSLLAWCMGLRWGRCAHTELDGYRTPVVAFHPLQVTLEYTRRR
jgi:hypothetical protein